PIVDASSRVIGVLVGRPDNPSWEQTHQRAFETIRRLAKRCAFPPKVKKHRRGDFPALSWGISQGPGGGHPGNLYHYGKNKEALLELVANADVGRMAGLANGAFATWAPDLYDYCDSHFRDLLNHDCTLRRNWPNNVWPTFAINFGPKTICKRHRDFGNLPFGLCSITALGDFDPTQGGHLVLWDLMLVIEFPPGSTILIPSSAIEHSNTPIGRRETRCSFTQYSPGGLFRWVEQGFQLTPEFECTLDDEGWIKEEEKNRERCALGLSLFWTVDKILKNKAACS
ncbi:hypothetical protein BJ912DRAFT_867330, partial [Pholiota molesta]